jgi:gliding motility-associated-like protein
MNKYLSRLSKIIITLQLFLYAGSALAQIAVTANQTATVLAQRLAGNGITITNATLTCAAAANGSFVVTSSNLGLDSGIVLTTGNAASVATSEPALTSFNNNTNGDPALQALSGASTTRDACILQFDLVPKGDTIKFEYVFGSEEYINSVCGPYNDAFAFFISGPGITGTQNMAQVPGTTIPVAVNSINNGIPGSFGSLPNCTSMGAGSPFTAFYNNNAGGATVAYRGLTTVLTAAHAVIPCNTYHLKLTIADALNGLYDSGVFIKAGSLQSSTFSVTAQGPVSNAGVPALYKSCLPGSFTFSRSVAKPTAQTLNFQITGTAINGTDYTTLPTSVTIPANALNILVPVNGISTLPAGIKNLKVALIAPFSCNGATELIDSAELHIIDAPLLSLITEDTTICEGAFINIEANSSTGLTYNWSPPIGLNSTNVLNPLANPTSSTTYTLKAYAAGSGCDTLSATLTIDVLPQPLFVDAGEDIDICEHTPISIIPLIAPPNSAFTYLWTSAHGSVSQQELNIPDPLVAQSGKYYFTVSSGICGALTDSVMINIVEFPVPPKVDPLKVCLNEEIRKLPVEGSNLKWYKDAAGGIALDGPPKINTAAEGAQSFYVSQSYGTCESERTPFTVVVERCCDDFLFIPSAFTPNQDGINDYFEMKVRNGSRITRVEIFNRWGQMVYLEDGDLPWNGMHNGAVVDLGTYFYRVTFNCKDGTIIYKKGEVLVVK